MPIKEKYRPLLHMTPHRGWMNDPNGLVYFNDEYHMFYQYYPHDTVWGPMHWGHVVSRDLIHWRELEPALAPDEQGMCFSGSAIVDWHNTSGLFADGKPGLLAFYTGFIEQKKTLANGQEITDPNQHQSLAYSQDGYTWHKYQGGAPIIPARGNPDFRDPKVIWHAPSERWIMVVSCGQHIEFYRSANLLDWELISEFGYREGAHSKGPWECPDLFELTIEGSTQKRWVLVVGIGEGAHCGGAGTQYFIGDFDGERFVSENAPQDVLWLDYGRDYYATQSWSDIPEADGRRVAISWMSNHQYSLELPTEQFRSAMTLPREFYLYQGEQGTRLGQRFVRELTQALGEHVSLAQPAQSLAEQQTLEAPSFEHALYMSLELSMTNGSELTLSLCSQGESELCIERTDLGYVLETVRQGSCGTERFDAFYPHRYTLPPVTGETLKLQMVVDHGSLELLVNDGQLSVTQLLYAEETTVSPRVSMAQGAVTVRAWQACEYAGMCIEKAE